MGVRSGPLEDRSASEIGHGDWTEPFVRSESSGRVRHQERGVMRPEALLIRELRPEARRAIISLN